MVLKEYSYGIIPFQKFGNEWKVFLVQHGRAKYWGFPKGHAEGKESPKEAASRELYEETRLKIVRYFSDTPNEEHYHYMLCGRYIDKTVYLFAAEVEGEVHLQKEEVSGGDWLPIKEAIHKLTYEIDKSACQLAAEGVLGIL